MLPPGQGAEIVAIKLRVDFIVLYGLLKLYIFYGEIFYPDKHAVS